MKKYAQLISILIFLTVFVGCTLAAAPSITQASYSPSPAVPGTTITLFIQLENNEAMTKEDVVVSIDNNYPFSVVEEFEKEIGSIEKFGKALAQFKIYVDPSAENATYLIPIKVVAKNGPTITVSKPIIISGKEPSVKVTAISDEKLIPGQEKTITFEIQNIGTSTAYDIIVELQEDRTVTTTGVVVEREITPLGPALGYISQLNPKQKATVDIKVSVNREADLKNYTLPVKITFRNSSGTNTEETSYIGFKVAGEVNIDAILKETSAPLLAGTIAEIIIELFNKDEGKAEYTIVELSSDFGVAEKAKQFIGSLEPNDVDSFKTNFRVNADAKTGTQNIQIAISYQDTDARNKTALITVPVMIYSLQDSAAAGQGSPIGGIMLLVIIVIIIIVGWKLYTKKKKK